jgi:membrane protease YdiL (CAAX protease family)
MQKLLSKVPFPVEFAVIVAGAFGYSIFDSARDLLQHHVASGPTEAGTWWEVGYEAGTIIVLGLVLWARGWNFKRLGLETDWRDGPWALALAFGCILASVAFAVFAQTLFPGLMPGGGGDGDAHKLSLAVVGALVIVNALFEELFACGYVIGALKEKGLGELGFNLSVAIRLVLYVFQGVAGVLVMVPVGLIFGFWYLRTGRLWPAILGHIVLNAWFFASLAKL